MGVSIPDGMPSLSAGDHEWDEGKACVMEYVSVLAGERFSDSPSCTHPVIACAARYVNDRVCDEDRHLLVPLIHRIAAAGPHVGVTDALHRVLGIDHDYGSNMFFAPVIGTQVAWYMSGTLKSRFGFSKAKATREEAVRGVNLLTCLLDEHQRVTGIVPNQLSEAALRGARRLVESRAMVLAVGHRG